MKLLLVLPILLLLVCCGTPSYTRSVDGSIDAKNGTVTMTYQPDGKTLLSESFIPNDQLNWFTKMIGGMSGQIDPTKMNQLLQFMTLTPK
jgi:hypothetical protein